MQAARADTAVCGARRRVPLDSPPGSGAPVSHLQRFSQFLLQLGVPGLFLIALLDSAAVPMVGGPDAVIVLLSWSSPSQIPAIVLAGTIGSLLGCLILYRIGMAGGKLALAHVNPEKRERAMKMIERNSTWAAFMSVAMPPPFPTKPVILAAGVFRAPLPSFSAAILAGRLPRYSALAWLGARFGDQALQVVKTHTLAVVAFVLCAVAAVLLVRRLCRK
jgi:membrane protein YqaA with SNARE-associated domain